MARFASSAIVGSITPSIFVTRSAEIDWPCAITPKFVRHWLISSDRSLDKGILRSLEGCNHEYPRFSAADCKRRYHFIRPATGFQVSIRGCVDLLVGRHQRPVAFGASG